MKKYKNATLEIINIDEEVVLSSTQTDTEPETPSGSY